MANIQEYRNSEGKLISCKIVVSMGYDKTGKQVRKTKRLPIPPDLSQRQADKYVQKEALLFEEQMLQGYQTDTAWTFADYAEYVLELKERSGVRPRTIDRYRGLLPRIDAAIGHMKLSQVRPQHLNAFYSNLAEPGVRKAREKAVARINLGQAIFRKFKSKAALSAYSGLGTATINAAIQGEKVSKETATKLCEALDMDYSRVFKTEKDMTTLSPKTILEHHRLISTILAQADKELLVPYNAATKATPPKSPRPVQDFYEAEEIKDILDCLEDEPLKWRTITYLLMDTGCRRGEILGLKWSSVDLETGVIVIERALLYTVSKGVYEGPTKTDRIRCLQLAPQSLALLREYEIEQKKLRLLNGDRWVDTGYVFTKDNGEWMSPDSITQWLSVFSDRHGLPHIHPHAFRHTAASLMIANGVDLVATAAELGHANVSTTTNIYAHQIAKSRVLAANIRGGVFAVQDKKDEKSQVG